MAAKVLQSLSIPTERSLIPLDPQTNSLIPSGHSGFQSNTLPGDRFNFPSDHTSISTVQHEGQGHVDSMCIVNGEHNINQLAGWDAEREHEYAVVHPFLLLYAYFW